MQEPRLKLYNTETRRMEELTPQNGQTFSMYTCGPTVYNFAHIGNFRTYVFEDLLRRTIKFFGFGVNQVMNLTDVDDKTIKGALERGISLQEFTKPYIEAFFEDIKTLGIEEAEHYPAATDYIEDMICIIERLMAKGYAYRGADNSIYYSIKEFPSYGRLSHLPIHELQQSERERLIADEYDKDNVADFVLWKIYDPERDGHIYWESPFGKGRPGWHMECSAMAMKILGETIDIHVGGVDNMFPHHENEIAQCEAFSEKHFVRHWLHAEHLLVEHKKMSKSLGNFFTLRDLLQRGYSGKEVRFALLQAHYRMQLNFTMKSLEAARSSLERLAAFINRIRAISEKSSSYEVEPVLKKLYFSFKSALADDLNISNALAALFEGVRELNALCDACKVGREEAKHILELFAKLDTVLGFLPLEEKEEVPKELEEALQKRQKARESRDWALADQYRDLILSSGYFIEDTPNGARIKKQRT